MKYVGHQGKKEQKGKNHTITAKESKKGVFRFGRKEGEGNFDREVKKRPQVKVTPLERREGSPLEKDLQVKRNNYSLSTSELT